MQTQQIAEKLINMCKSGQWREAQQELYDENAVSIEPAGAPFPERTEGMEAIQQKGDRYESMIEEVYGLSVTEPVVAGNFFTLKMVNDIKFQGMPRMLNEELCLYEVKDGKIIREQFFYYVPPSNAS